MSQPQRSREYIYNTAWLILEKIGRTVLGLGVTLVILRVAGPALYGQLSTAIALVAILEPLANLGLSGLFEKELIVSESKRTAVLVAGIAAKAISGTCLALILLGVLWGATAISGDRLILYGICSIQLFLVSGTCLVSWFNVQTKAKLIVRRKLYSTIIGSALKVCVVFLSTSLTLLAIVFQIEGLIFLGFAISLTSRFGNIGLLRESIDLLLIKKLVSQSWPLILSGIGLTIYLKIDILLLAAYLSDKEVGIYSAVVKISEGWYFLGAAVATSLFPPVARNWKKNRECGEDMLAKITWMLVGLGAGGSVGLYVTSGLIQNRVLGGAYEGSAAIISVHAWAGIFVFLGYGLSKWLIVENRLMYSIVRHLLGAVVNVVGNLLLIPRYGAAGAAWATVFAYSFSNLGVCLLFPALRPFLLLLVKRELLGRYKTLIHRP